MNTNYPDTPRVNILVVDDTPDNLRLLSTLLTRQGYEVGKALNGQMALTAAKTASLPARKTRRVSSSESCIFLG